MRGARAGEIDAPGLLMVLNAMAGPLPPPKYEGFDPASDLVWIVRDGSRARPDAAPPIEAIVATFKQAQPGARSDMLQLFTTRPSVESAQAYVEAMTGRLTGCYPFKVDGYVSIMGFGATQLHPGAPPAATREVAAAIFPDLLDATRWEALRHPIYLMLLEFLKARLIGVETIASGEREFVAALGETLEKAISLQEENKPGHLNWKYDGPYADVRVLAGMLLDLAGQWKSGAVIEAMKRVPPLTDPRLQMFHACSRLSLGITVDPAELVRIAESPRECYSLRRLGERTEWERFLPPACFHQEQLARGEMVDWLTFGTELDREPDEIELIHVETRREGKLFKRGPHIDYYFFKYRVTEEHSAAEDGWMVGMAGGYERTSRGTTDGDGGTFSRFTSFEEKSIEEHVKEYLD